MGQRLVATADCLEELKVLLVDVIGHELQGGIRGRDGGADGQVGVHLDGGREHRCSAQCISDTMALSRHPLHIELVQRQVLNQPLEALVAQRGQRLLEHANQGFMVHEHLKSFQPTKEEIAFLRRPPDGAELEFYCGVVLLGG